MSKRKYSPGDIIGPYTLIQYSDANPRKITCRCNNCGSVVDVFVGNAQKQRMCKNCRTLYNTKPKEDLTWQRFGRLTVLECIIKENGHIAWKCKCDCGNTVVVNTCHLKNGHTQSCGCYMKDRISETNSNDITGMRFGRLTTLSKTKGHVTPKGQVLSEYLCKCDCGNLVPVLALNLLKGNTQSCGCLGNSVGEDRINTILLQHNIYFRRQFSFPDLHTETGGVLKFDFAILYRDGSLCCLIEYNGEQHYYTGEKGNHWFGKLQRDVTDDMKDKYCTERSIKLFKIRFDDNLDEKINEVIRYYTK